ncbi:MAG: glycosyltransferase family 4 protein [Acidimicrobiia bacterium]
MSTGRKTLMLLVASNRRRGAEVFGERLAAGLPAFGWDVDFVAIQGANTERVVDAITLTGGESRARFDVSTVLSLRRRMARTRPAIVLANGGATLRYAVAARSLLLHRPILAYGSIGEPRYWMRSNWHLRLNRFLHRRADTILAVSATTGRQLVSDLGIPPDRVHVAPTGVPPEFFVASEPRLEQLQMLFLGSLSPEKDPLAAVEVAVQIGKSHDVHLRLVGAGPLEAEIAAWGAETSERVTIELTGSVEDVTPHLRWADLLLLTSRTEGLPGAVLEAGAAGVPTVAFDVGGTGETMVNGTSGILVPPGDVSAMVAAVERLAADRALLEAMGGEQRDHVRSNYSLDRAIARFDQLLTGALL